MGEKQKAANPKQKAERHRENLRPKKGLLVRARKDLGEVLEKAEPHHHQPIGE